MKVTVDMEAVEIILTKNWKTFQFKSPDNGRFSVNFINGNDPGNGVFIKYDFDAEVHFIGPEQWSCGEASEDRRCQIIRVGILRWPGEYKYTIKATGKIICI